jgi:hypothetical protein
MTLMTSPDDPRRLTRMVWVARVAEILNALVRPSLAYGFGMAVIYFTFVGTLTAEAFLGIAAMVIGFFFQSRVSEKAEERLRAQQEELVDLAKRLPPP